MTRKRPHKIPPKVRIVQNIDSGTHRFKDIFIGFEELEAVKRVFGERTSEELDSLNVEVFPRDGYMGVSDYDGHVVASQTYLNGGEEWCIYLDIVHELVHVRQFKEGKKLFDSKYGYVDRPTEIEAYRVGTEEARRIGLTDREIFKYLEVPWITRDELRRLAKACGVKVR
ncbi:MAG: hypothetical protein JRN20_12200 [Nitrososphaerota archaeon]|nr:hypothetical protein [Nitrososphaerota archaeon]MDG6921790.1 hypothetical protein [Nitrososphaerota archaeon]